MPTPKFADSELASGTCDEWALGEGSPGCRRDAVSLLRTRWAGCSGNRG